MSLDMAGDDSTIAEIRREEDGIKEEENRNSEKVHFMERLMVGVDSEGVREGVTRCCQSCGGLLDNRFRETLWPFLILNSNSSQRRNSEFGHVENKIKQSNQNGKVSVEQDDDSIERNFENRDCAEGVLQDLEYQSPSKEEIESHKDYYQVYVDVSRSLKRFPPSIQNEGSVVDKYMDDLIEVILKILDTDSDLHYYQGFHDVLVTFLMVLGKEKTFQVAVKLVQSHLKLFMTKTMRETSDALHLMYALFEKEDKKLFDFLLRAELGTIFALPWVITWFSHSLNDLELVLRLFDLFVASDPLLPIYLSAAIVMHARESVLSCECEMPMVHKLLGDSLNDPDMPWTDLIHRALGLINKYPPHTLEKRAKLIQEISAPKPRSQLQKKTDSGLSGDVISFVMSFVRQRPMFTAAVVSSVVLAYLFHYYNRS